MSITELFTPEDLDSDVRLMADAAADFMRGEVLPAADRIEAKEAGLMPALLRKAANLGLLGLDVPEAYGGLGLQKSASALISEALGVEPSFSVSHSVHTSVATLPILFFGTPEQKSKYLPQLASGERIGAYALSESHAGSDAMAARTRAAKTASGYCLTGEKAWITNAAFAGLFIVFAKTDEGLTAFIVEREMPGVSVGREERKLGLKGSSTCRLILDDVEVPAENVLGRPGEGGKIALYTLNLGRLKIAASSVGQCKNLLGLATRYANQRVTFGKPIAEHGLIQEKLAKMAARIYASESMLYRVAGYLDRAFEGIDPVDPASSEKYRAAAEEHAIECAIIKVHCTETLDYVTDETLQIHGGNGYTEEFPAARAWRDARVNRIYEGTSEINRLNIAGMTLRRIEQDRIQAKDSVIAVARECIPDLSDKQIVLAAIANRLIGEFELTSASERAVRKGPRVKNAEPVMAALCLLSQNDAYRIDASAETVLGACGECGNDAWERWKQWEAPCAASSDNVPRNYAGAIEDVARAVIDSDGYPW